MWRDLRFGLRMLARHRAFAATVVLSLALGIGVNTAVFSVLDAAFFRPLDVDHAERLVAVQTTDEGNPTIIPQVSRDNFIDLQSRARSFDSMFAWVPVPGLIEVGDDTEWIHMMAVTDGYFETLGVEAYAGRLLHPADQARGVDDVPLVLSYVFWQDHLGGEAEVLGTTLEVSGHPFEIVGIAPPEFEGTAPFAQPVGWSTMDAITAVEPKLEMMLSRRGLTHNTVARLAEGVDLETARAEAKAIGDDLAAAYPDANYRRSFAVHSLSEVRVAPEIKRQVVRASSVLFAVVSFVLLIACANVANLLLARAHSRRGELAIRQAVGATPNRVLRQLVVESLLIAVLGGALGVLIAVWATDFLQSLLPVFDPIAPKVDIEIDGRTLAFAATISLLTAGLFGLAPAMRALKRPLARDLKLHNQISGGRSPRLRRVLVVVQVALSLVATVGAGLFLHSLVSARQIDPGFDYQHTSAVNVAMPGVGFTERELSDLHERIEQSARSVRGVQSVSLAEQPPMISGIMRTTLREENGEIAEHGPVFHMTNVGAEFFETLSIELRSGQRFDEATVTPGYLRAIVNESMAKAYWPGEDPVGKKFRFIGFPISHEVVGVVADSKVNTLGEDPTPMIYGYYPEARRPGLTVVLRSDDPGYAAQSTKVLVEALDPRLTVQVLESLGVVVERSLWGARMAAWMLASFAVLAIALAAIGVYGLMNFIVGQSTREIGVRMAMGAAPRRVLSLLMRRAMAPVLVGVCVGLVLALPLGFILETVLYDVMPVDPVTYVLSAAILVAVGAASAWWPARQATRIDPMEALRDR